MYLFIYSNTWLHNATCVYIYICIHILIGNPYITSDHQPRKVLGSTLTTLGHGQLQFQDVYQFCGQLDHLKLNKHFIGNQ